MVARCAKKFVHSNELGVREVHVHLHLHGEQCGTEEKLMKVKGSYKFLDDKTEMAGGMSVCEEEHDVYD